MKLYKVQAVIDGRMGKTQFQYASYRAREALLDAGLGGVTVSGYSILRDKAVIELELTLGRAEGAARTASIALAQLLLSAEGYYEGLEEDAAEEEDLEGLEDVDDVELSRKAIVELARLEDDGYGEEAFALLYAEGFFEPPGGEPDVLRLPEEIAHLGMQTPPPYERAWQDVLTLQVAEPVPDAAATSN